MLSSGTLSQIKTAFKKVYRIKNGNKSDEISDSKIITYGSEILSYSGKYPFETDVQRNRRYTINDLAQTSELQEYMSDLPDEVDFLGQKTVFGKLFAIGKVYGIGYQEEEEQEDTDTILTNEYTEDIKEVKEVVQDLKDAKEVEFDTNDIVSNSIQSDENEYVEQLVDLKDNTKSSTSAPETVSVSIDNHTNFEEDKKMENEQGKSPIDMLEEEAKKSGVGTPTDSNVTEVSKNDRDAARKIILSEQEERINFSENASIPTVVVVKLDRAEKATKGLAAMGTVSNPARTLASFILKSGCTVKDGVVTFTKLHPSQLYDDAKAVYELLVAATKNPLLEVKPYFGKEGVPVQASIKGIVLEDLSKKRTLIAFKDISKMILDDAFTYVNVASKTKAQFILDAATPRAGQKPKKSYVVKIANKSELLEDTAVCVEAKTIDKNAISESKSGFKSEQSLAFNSSVIGADLNPKKLSWRIPLEVEQYDVITLDEYAQLFVGAGGNSTKPISAKEDAKNIVDTITKLLAVSMSGNNKDGIVSEKLKASFNSAKNEIIAADAAAVNETLNSTDLNDADYEG